MQNNQTLQHYQFVHILIHTYRITHGIENTHTTTQIHIHRIYTYIHKYSQPQHTHLLQGRIQKFLGGGGKRKERAREAREIFF